MNELLGSIVILFGAIFLFLGSLGTLRMPDSFNRIQAGTKATTMGTLLTLTGVCIYHPAWIGKIVILLLFIVLTNPTSSHALARAAHITGIPLVGSTVIDKLRESRQKENDLEEDKL
ncbi:monovalent cation/H(+) antiporter subunit G [bacterium]|nr:monovalent cation/H(+) antiporter subunit G [bacterium]